MFDGACRSMQTRVISQQEGSMMEIVHWLCMGAGTAVVAIAWLLRRHPTRPNGRRARRARACCSPTTARGTAFARLSTIR
jgi:hypothetical protein